MFSCRRLFFDGSWEGRRRAGETKTPADQQRLIGDLRKQLEPTGKGKRANVDTTVPRRKGRRQKYPEMSAPMTLLKRRLQPILPEVKTEPTKGYGAATARLVGFTPPFSLTWQCEAAPFLS